MASTPDNHPDSLPPETPGAIERVDPDLGGGHPADPVDSPPEDAGGGGGAARTGSDRGQDDPAR